MTYKEIKTEQVDGFIEELKSSGELATLVKISSTGFYQIIAAIKPPPSDGKRPAMIEFECEVIPTEYCNDHEKIREYMMLTDLSSVVAWGFATQAGTWGEIIPTVLLEDAAQVATEIPLSMRDVIAAATQYLLQGVLQQVFGKSGEVVAGVQRQSFYRFKPN